VEGTGKTKSKPRPKSRAKAKAKARLGAGVAIVACKWHPLTAMENAARDGFSYEAGTVVLPVKCTGLIKVSFLLRLFAKDIEGVLVLGCDEGDCRYFNGSERCGRIVDEAKDLLELTGIPGRRLEFRLIRESQGKDFKRAYTTFMKHLGREPGRSKRVTSAGHK
jgi:F420-non-reducing hydrogenase iron-sulfur subunit